jgi:predicted nucleic acid-binding protein
VAGKSAYRWFETKGSETVGWCLPIRLAILRHLSNRHIMGSSVLDPTQALDIWARLEADERLFEIDSIPAESEKYFRLNVRGRSPSPQIWTDAWLAAVAEASYIQMVSFDRDFERFNLTSLEILTP